MEESLWQQFMNWICKEFGHNGKIDRESPGGGDPEVCTRCKRLLSTAYSRGEGIR